jgi:DNA modification methylase
MSVRVIEGDCVEALRALPDCFRVNCCVTSPPYWGLRDYGHAGQIGLEQSPAEYVAKMVEVFRAVRDKLADDGTLWLNLGDSYSTHAAGKVANPMAKSTLAGVRTQEVANESSRAMGAYMKCPSLPEKNLIGIPWRVAFALQADGWYLRSDIIWSKPNPMPESVTDRPTKAHEYIFLLSKSERYFYDAAAIREPLAEVSVLRAERANTGTSAPGQTPHSGICGPRKSDKQRGHGRRHAGFNDRWDAMEKAEQQRAGANKRTVWEVATQPFSEAHFATFPPALIEPCIKAGCPEGGTVLDPFGGAGTTGLVADRLKRNALLIELNPEYAAMARKRISGDCPMFSEVA